MILKFRPQVRRGRGRQGLYRARKVRAKPSGAPRHYGTCLHRLRSLRGSYGEGQEELPPIYDRAPSQVRRRRRDARFLLKHIKTDSRLLSLRKTGISGSKDRTLPSNTGA